MDTPMPSSTGGRSGPTVRSGRVSRVASRRWRTRCPTTWPPGCPASPTKAGTRPFRLAVWPSRMGSLARSDPRGGWDGVHIPTSADATAGIEKRGSLRPRPPVSARRSRPGGRGATTIRTTTCAVADMHVRTWVSRTSGSVSHVRPSHGTGRSAPLAGQPPNRGISNADNRDIFRAD